jgi:molybdate transport system substrate-binding protein
MKANPSGDGTDGINGTVGISGDTGASGVIGTTGIGGTIGITGTTGDRESGLRPAFLCRVTGETRMPPCKARGGMCRSGGLNWDCPETAGDASSRDAIKRGEDVMRFTIRALLVAASTFGAAQGAFAAEVHVMISGGFSAAYKELVPLFEKATGNTVVTAYGPSMGETPQAIPMRLSRGEPADVLIMVGYALGDLVTRGDVIAASRIDLADSLIGVAVKTGAPKPDLSSPDTLKAVLLAVKTVAYSDSASGEYVSKEMFAKLGILEAMNGKARKIPATPVGEIVAKGDAEIGFQQISELKPVSGIDIVGPLPDALQKVTVFSAGLATKAPQPEAGKALMAFLSSKEAAPVMIRSGLDPKVK